jgi:hypothetical protein
MFYGVVIRTGKIDQKCSCRVRVLFLKQWNGRFQVFWDVTALLRLMFSIVSKERSVFILKG